MNVSAILTYKSEALSLIAIVISIWAAIFPSRKSTKSFYCKAFNENIGSLTLEVYSHKKNSEQKCVHYLDLISKPKNNHIRNKIKRDKVSECCTNIRRLLPKLSNINTKNTQRKSILGDISTHMTSIEVDVKDFCYK